MTAIATNRQTLLLAAPLVPAFCYESRRRAAASFASGEELQRAGEVLLGLLRRGMTSVPFGVVLDWTLLVDREWDFPSRTLEHAMHDTRQIPRQQHFLHGLPPEYENECLNPYLLSPWFRRVRDTMVLRGRSVARIVHLLEQIFEGLESHLSARFSHYELDPAQLPFAFDAFTRKASGILDETTQRAASQFADLDQLEQKHPGLVDVLHDEVAGFLRARLSQEPRPVADDADPGTFVDPFRPSDIDVYELEHVEIFTSRVARLRCRRFGEIGQALGMPETRGLQRRVDIPEIVVNRDDETHYPAGGVAELTTSGSFENLLPSELMYMEDDPDQVDIFSLKYVENELLYFVRDAGLLVRRRRRINICVWDVTGFRIKYPQQKHPLDVWLDGMLVRLVQDMFDFFEGEGLLLTAHWVFPAGRDGGGRASRPRASAGRDPNQTIMAGAGDSHELFDLLFRNETEKRLANFHVHNSSEAMAAWLRENDHPFNQWAVLLPPSERARPDKTLRHLTPVWADMCKRGARPSTVVSWTTDPAQFSPPDALNLMATTVPQFETVQRVDESDENGLRDVRFAWPTDTADPTAALRDLRQFLLHVLVSFI